jgi:hypothetical protein
MNRPAVTYIVSAHSRPLALRCVLASLQCQTDPNFEVIVADNYPRSANFQANQQVVKQIQELWEERFQYVNTAQYATDPAWDCYWSAEWVVNSGLAKGEFLCFPSDDSYYMPVFQETLVNQARLNNWSLVFCDMVYDRRMNGGKYAHFTTDVYSGRIDKMCFLLRRDAWIGFPDKPHGTPAPSDCDGKMIAQITRGTLHVPYGHIEEILCVHN